ncbi:8313_t:CDS:2 [Funneliformis geosporum]|uniref:8313_t:CDS:1 n=1 Tax=Funneliformis geosporum TaxID=1117311 RepID=A0A9W4T3J1_9GLOM|nr:8313_t:CDS:2 [Funneliformis geosporum]
MPIIIVHVVFNYKTIFEWEGLPVNKDMDIEEFFKNVVVYKLKPELWEKNWVAYFSHTKMGETEKIGLNSMNTVNAFELMRSASMFNYLSEFKLPAKNSWEQLRIDLTELIRKPLLLYANNLIKYAEYLINQRVITAKNQSSLIPVVNEGKTGYIEIFNENTWRKPEIVKEFHILTKTLQELEYWKPININQFCPESRKQRSRFIEKLMVAFPFKIGKYTYHHGNIQNSVYV